MAAIDSFLLAISFNAKFIMQLLSKVLVLETDYYSTVLWAFFVE